MKYYLILYSKPNSVLNYKAHDICNKYLPKYCEVKYLDQQQSVDFIKIHNEKECVIYFYQHGSSGEFHYPILQFLQQNVIIANIFFFTFDFWQKTNYHDIVFKATNYKVIMFPTLQELNHIRNFDFTPYCHNFIYNNIWCCYDTSFISFNSNPIHEILISGEIDQITYPDRFEMTKYKHTIKLKRTIVEDGKNDNYNKNLNKYVACFASPTYRTNLTTNKIINTHIILLKTYEILAAGSLLVMPLSEETYLKKIGLINNIHCILIDMTSNIQQQINSILSNSSIHIIRENGHEYAKKYLNSEKKFKELQLELYVQDYK